MNDILIVHHGRHGSTVSKMKAAPTTTEDKAMTIQPGDKVIVCDNTPKPPKHHTRKLRHWRARNFAGTVEEISLFSVHVLDDQRSSRVMKMIMGCRPEHVFLADQVKPEILDRLEAAQ